MTSVRRPSSARRTAACPSGTRGNCSSSLGGAVEARAALPLGGWAKLATVESGWWASAGAESVEIPAALGYDGGVWYAIGQGIRGVLVRDERDGAGVRHLRNRPHGPGPLPRAAVIVLTFSAHDETPSTMSGSFAGASHIPYTRSPS